MKQILKMFFSLTFFIGIISGYSQVTAEEAKLIQDAFGVEKKEILMMYMSLPEDAAAKFWPLYDDYMGERKKLGADRYQILKDYADSYVDLSPERADDLTVRLFKNTMAIEKLQLKYYKKMRKAVNALEASKFIQAEKYIESTMRMQLQNSIPFIGEMDLIRG